MTGVLPSLRDRGYLACVAALAAMIVLSGAISVASSGGDGSGSSASARSTEAVARLNAQRLTDLDRAAGALELYRERNGAYPSTSGNFTTLCAEAFDAGCQLLSVEPGLRVTDGEHLYWYQSDGSHYTLFAHVTGTNVPGCALPAPHLLTEPVYCLTNGDD